MATVSELEQAILDAFRSTLPDSYIAEVDGPFYSVQFRQMARELAKAQVEANGVLHDHVWDLTRPDRIWEMLGAFVFPPTGGPAPTIDLSAEGYREFLLTMARLLLRGATLGAVEEGIRAMVPGLSPIVSEGRHRIDITLEGSLPRYHDLYAYNLDIVLQALKPAHILYSFGYLFRESVASGEGADPSADLEIPGYEDSRRYHQGQAVIAGELTVLGRRLVEDPAVSFERIVPGAPLRFVGTDLPPVVVREILTPTAPSLVLRGGFRYYTGPIGAPTVTVDGVTIRVDPATGRVLPTRLAISPLPATTSVGATFEYEVQVSRLGALAPETAVEQVAGQTHR